MAELGGAALSFVVDKLLEKVLDALKLVLNATKNILRLQNLLKRSQRPVKELCNSVRGKSHPADEWLTELRKQLQKSHELVKAFDDSHGNIIKRYFRSKESLEVYRDIQDLLKETSLQQWASGMSIRYVHSDRDAKMLSAIKTVLAEDEGLGKIADLSSNESGILSRVSHFEQVFNTESSGVASSSSDPTPTLRTDRACVSKPEVTFGGEAVANKIINHLLNEECGKWVGLWGIGGIGKTFTARKVFHDSKIQRHFSGGIFWLTISKDQAGPIHLLRQLLQKIKGDEYVSQLPTDLGAAKLYLKDLLDRDRVLLVLDDVWQGPRQGDVLEDLDVISESKKGVILVTTRDQSVLRKVINLVEIFEIPPLSEEDSWKLFYHACCGHGGLIPLEVETVAKEMAAECRGLPLALEVIGSTMASKELVPAEKVGRTTLRVWEQARDQLKNANDAQDEFGALYLKLQLSVDSLSEHDSRLQDCFFYFAAFPEDEHIGVAHMVSIWIAEGLVQGDSMRSLSAQEEGRVLLGVLAAKSMIEVIWGGIACKIHDVLRDLALRNLKRNISTGNDIEASARECLYAPGLHQDKLPQEWIVSATPFSAKRLSLQRNHLKRFPEPEQFCAPHLQVLLLSRNGMLESLSPKFFQSLSRLRVLDLSQTGIEKIPGALLRGLKSLVMLDLSFCRRLRKVSHEIGRLQSLEFLNLSNCEQLQELSDNLDRLQTLKVLDLSSCDRLGKLPRVNNLKQLDTYHTPTIHAGDGGRHLQSWRPWRMGDGFVTYVLPDNLREFSLKISSAKYLFNVSSLGSLEKFTMSGIGRACNIHSILAGVTKWRQVKVVKLTTSIDGKWLRSLGDLPLLEKLKLSMIEEKDDGIELCSYEREFLSLKKLTIESRKMFVFHPGTMPQIESLCLQMKSSKNFPTSLVELRSLKRLELRDYGPYIGRRGEDLVSFVKQPDCFPHLESLTISGKQSDCVPHLESLTISEEQASTRTFEDYYELPNRGI